MKADHRRIAAVDFRPIFAYPLFGDKQKESGAVLIAASMVAAIRLRGQEIKPSPKLNAVVHDSILLARAILAQMERRDTGRIIAGTKLKFQADDTEGECGLAGAA